MVQTLSTLLSGVGTTLLLLVLALGIGFTLGVPIGILHVYGRRPLRLLLSGYDAVMRGFPAIVLLFLIYFGIGSLPGVRIPSLHAAILALGLRSAAYQGRLVEGTLRMVPMGQLESALAVGMRRTMAIRRIVLPQALRFSLPGLANEYSIVLKDTALAFTVGVIELMSRAKFLAASKREIAQVYLLAAALYWILTQLGLLGFGWLERRARISGLGSGRR